MSSAFDALASGYDELFTESRIGGAQRRAVRARLEAAFEPGMRVLDLGCGTGEDALGLAARGVRVLGVDASAAMIEVARGKARDRGLEGAAEFRVRGMLEASGMFSAGGDELDGVYSNFGAINCVSERRELAERLAGVLKPGAPVLLCGMGPYVPWEWAWFLARGEARKAGRRMRRGGVEWRGLRIEYPSAGRLMKEFGAWFERRAVRAVGALVPPSYAEAWARRHPRWMDMLETWERRLETAWPLPYLADHYLLELVRR